MVTMAIMTMVMLAHRQLCCRRQCTSGSTCHRQLCCRRQCTSGSTCPRDGAYQTCAKTSATEGASFRAYRTGAKKSTTEGAGFNRSERARCRSALARASELSKAAGPPRSQLMGGRSDELASSRKRQGLLDKLVSFRKWNGADQSLVSLCISRCVRAMRMTCGCHVARVQCYHGAQECHQGTHWSSEGCRRIALRARVLHGWCRGSSSVTK